MRHRLDLPARVARLVLCALLVVAWSDLAKLRVAAAAAPAAPAPDEAAAAAEVRREVDAARRAIRAETFDVTAVVAQVGREPARLFEWVRDRTYWVPYHGALRGPEGVLMDRLGNSLDRALLLAALFHKAGLRARLVRGELAEADAQQLLAAIRPAPAEPLPAAPAAARAGAPRIGAASVELDRLAEETAQQAADLTALSGAVRGSVGELGAALDPHGGGKPPPEPPATGVLTAEWIEYEVRAPGAKPRTIRRQIFDLVGPAARTAAADRAKLTDEQRTDRALALDGRTSLLVLGAQPSPDFVQHLALTAIADRADLLPALARPITGPPPKPTADRMAELTPPPPAALYAVAILRHQWSPHRERVYLDRPTVLAHHGFVRRGPAAGDLRVCEAIDIVANDVAVKPAAAAEKPHQVRLEQGVFDTVAETALGMGCGRFDSAAGTLSAAAAQGIKWVTLRGAADPALAKLRLPPDDRARIERDLAQGAAVVVPERPVPPDAPGAAPGVAWWRIDPATGTTLGIGLHGWGPSMTERAALVYVRTEKTIREYRLLACSVMATAVVCALICAYRHDMVAADVFFGIAKKAKAACKGAP